jgi:molybdopterin-binding protein
MDQNQDSISAGDAARELGISLDTLRRWDRQGRITVTRDHANRRRVPATEIARLRGSASTGVSARNRLSGTVRAVKVDGLLAQVEIELTAPGRVVAVITRDAVEALDLRPGVAAHALVKSTSVMVERG